MPVARYYLLLGLVFFDLRAAAEGLGADVLGVIFNRDDPASTRIAQYYAARRHIPAQNLVGLGVPDRKSVV